MRFSFKHYLYAIRTALFRDRNGSDEFSRFLLFLSLLPLIIGVTLYYIPLPRLSFLFLFGFIILSTWSIWRMLSSDTAKRKNENDLFVSSPAYYRFSSAVLRFSQRKEYRFFRCPHCKKMLRVPRGKGKIRISCPDCGTSFIRNT